MRMMLNHIRSKIKKIKIQTKRMMHNALVGDYLSAFRGTGLEFHQIRAYQEGDDIRSIDWKSSAKLNNIMVKEFVEHRERTILVALDTSRSLFYGSRDQLKHEVAQDIAAALVCIGQENKDNIGLLLFNDTVHQAHQPKKGSIHASNLLNSIYTAPITGGTNIRMLCDHLLKHPHRNAVLFIISDWLIDTTEALTRFNTLAKVYDIIIIQVTDPCELQLPDIGLMSVHDPETGALITINTTQTNKLLAQQQAALTTALKRYRMRCLRISTNTPWIAPLSRFLQARTSY
jgi:uncharacterized protein (DUF58 family)